jgi:hypothetical protein
VCAGCRFIVLKYLDLITIAVPPALPACLTVATTIAISRLAKHDIFVSNPSAIAAAGHLNVICFDKTGTLTEVGALHFACALHHFTLAQCCMPMPAGGALSSGSGVHAAARAGIDGHTAL